MSQWRIKQFKTIKPTSITAVFPTSAAMVLVYFYFKSHDIAYLGHWLICALIINFLPAATALLAHSHHNRHNRQNPSANFPYEKYIKLYSTIKWLSCFAWTFPAFVILPQVSIEKQFLLGALFAGLASGSLTTHVFSRNLSFAVLAVYSVYLASVPIITTNSFDYSFGLLILFFVGALTIQAAILTSNFRSEFNLVLQNNALAEDNRLKAQNMIHHERAVMLSQITGGVAHEINNPLSIIVGYAENIQNMAQENHLDQSRILRDSTRILSATERVSAIIKSLRRIARDGSQDPFETISVKSLVEENVSYFSSQISKSGIRIDCSDVLEDLYVQGQPGELSQVLLNLISNALDAIKDLPEKWIKIKAEATDNEVSISVTDSGNGIPLDLQDHIMIPFFTTKDVGKGVGLGLSLSNSIVEVHKGQLRLDTQSTNTRFVISLPRHYKPSAASAA